MRYQETWIGGPSGAPFQRECAARYEPIKAFLSQYKRPFSVFDLGANMGYFSFRIATDFPQATVVAVDNKPELPNLAAANGLRNVVVLPRRLSAKDVAALADCEAFDVVLALNVLHHMEDFRAALAWLTRLGFEMILETPGSGDTNAAHPQRHNELREFVRECGEVLRTGTSHVTKGAERIMAHVHCAGAKELKRQTIDAAPDGYVAKAPSDIRMNSPRHAPPMGKVLVAADFERAEISIARPKNGTTEARPFIPGINLWNFRLLGGCWPKDAPGLVKREVERLSGEGLWMDDLRPWNFILAHDGVRAIDIGWKRRRVPEPEGLKKCLGML